MITLNVVGSFEGYEESKSHPGKFFVYVKPIAAPPSGLLRSVKCRKDFGAPADGMQRIGNFAVLCDPEQLPAVGVGEKVALSAGCWPISRPVWSEREMRVVNAREISPLYVLDGEIKPSNAKAAPPAFIARGYYQGAVRLPTGQVQMHCMIEDTPPSWLLRQRRVQKGKKGYTTGDEVLGNFSITAEADHMPVLSINAPVEAKGACWPVCDPYWDADSDSVTWQKVPSPVFVTTANITAEKAKGAA